MTKLPPGQKESDIFPRFGLPQYANRFPDNIDDVNFLVSGDLESYEIKNLLPDLPRTNQISDFHCVTTWSKLGLLWSGYLFKDFYDKIVCPKTDKEFSFVVLRAQDGYKTSLPLEDLLQNNVLLADRLNDQPLGIEHGAPIRIVVPDHYGYKNIKHIKSIEFFTEKQVVKQGFLSFMDHPRARVAQEERASYGPGILFRWLYKFGIAGTIKDFEDATATYKANKMGRKV